MNSQKKDKILIDLQRVMGVFQSIIDELQYALKDIQETHREIHVKWDRKQKDEK